MKTKIRPIQKRKIINQCNSTKNYCINEILDSLIPGNAVVEMEKMPPECIDLAITSPPYDDLRDYKGYLFEFNEIASGLFRVLKQGGVLVWVVGDKINGGRSLTSFRQGIIFQELGFIMHDIMIYNKKNTPFMRSNAYTNSFEFMFILTKGKPKTFNPLKEKTIRNGYEMLVHNKKSDGVNKKVLKELKKEKTRTNIWSYAVGMGGTTSDKIAFQHPAVFPEKLALDHILSWSNEGDIVFDPMCGSGTTCKMAKKVGRRYIGIDISEEYIEIAKKRIEVVNNEQMGCLPF
ncbi:MAG: site-specific DNA-methyltransferase [Holophagaceae bacterium]|nr:site-specific DNA-methyltransferase [Holophagaceae bacterium]